MAATAPESNEDIRAEILAAQQAFEEDFKKQGLYVTHAVKYRYALALSKSTDKEDWMLARCYFNDLWQVGHEVRRSRLEIAKLHLKLGDFRKCRQMCQQLIALPSNREDGSEDEDLAEVERLHQEVVDRVYREGKIGLAAVVAIAVVFGGLVLWSRQSPAAESASGDSK